MQDLGQCEVPILHGLIAFLQLCESCWILLLVSHLYGVLTGFLSPTLRDLKPTRSVHRVEIAPHRSAMSPALLTSDMPPATVLWCLKSGPLVVQNHMGGTNWLNPNSRENHLLCSLHLLSS